MRPDRFRLAGILVIIAVILGMLAAARTRIEDHQSRHFTTDGTRIVAPSGDTFVPVGMNLLGSDAFFNPDGKTFGLAPVLDEAWQVNTVRLNTCLPVDGCAYNTVSNERNEDLGAIVRELTARGIVVVIALHEIRPGGFPDDAHLERIADWWRETARTYAHDPYVWFNLLNEPGKEAPASDRWLEVHRRLLAAVRSTGAENPVVVDGTGWGQETGGVTELDLVREEDSAVMTFGPTLAEEFDNVIFSFHVYNGWGDPDGTDAERDAKMADYIDRVHALDLPLLVGEVGGTSEPCCDPKSLGAAAALRVAPARGVGLLFWHGQAVDDHRLVHVDRDHTSPTDIDDWRNPSNLTWLGRLLWDLTHG